MNVEPTEDNLRSLTQEDAKNIYKYEYWASQNFDKISNKKVAFLIFDWNINSGGAKREIQKMLNNKYKAELSVDGIFGHRTIEFINNVQDPNLLCEDILKTRESYYEYLADINDRDKNNLKGWKNRIKELREITKTF